MYLTAEIAIDQHMAHLDDLWPWNLMMGLAKRGGELAGCFADDLNMVNHPGVDEFVFLEDGPTALRIPFDSFDGIEDILQASAIIPHKAIASLRTSLRSGWRGRRDAGLVHLVGLVWLVYLVCFVHRTRETK